VVPKRNQRVALRVIAGDAPLGNIVGNDAQVLDPAHNSVVNRCLQYDDLAFGDTKTVHIISVLQDDFAGPVNAAKGGNATGVIPPKQATDMPGMWQRYYTRWKAATREQLDPALLEVLPPLAKLCPPATVIDKTRYSAFVGPQLFQHLQAREADGLIVTGSETDVCVLATVLGAVDLGYRVILVRDAVCSSSDEGHDQLMKLYHQRYTEQIEVADAATILERWEP